MSIPDANDRFFQVDVLEDESTLPGIQGAVGVKGDKGLPNTAGSNIQSIAVHSSTDSSQSNADMLHHEPQNEVHHGQQAATVDSNSSHSPNSMSIGPWIITCVAAGVLVLIVAATFAAFRLGLRVAWTSAANSKQIVRASSIRFYPFSVFCVSVQSAA